MMKLPFELEFYYLSCPAVILVYQGGLLKDIRFTTGEFAKPLGFMKLFRRNRLDELCWFFFGLIMASRVLF